MHWYRDCILPHLIHLAMRQDNLQAYRRRIIPAAEGRVLEIGIGSGLNLPLYAGRAREVIGLEPSPRLVAMAREAVAHARIPVELIEGDAERIPLADNSVDTVVTTWTLCSIPSAMTALQEMRRVLKPGGRLLFVEHGRAPEADIQRWQDRLTPIWKRIGGGCHLNRAIGDMIAGAGFQIERMDLGYMKGPKPMTYMYEGSARPI